MVAQLVRVPACHAGGRGFEPRPPRQVLKIPTLGSVFFRLPDLMGLSVLGLFRPDIAVLIRFCIIGWYFRYGFGQLLRAVLMLLTVVSMGRRMLADFMASFLPFCRLKCRQICRMFLKMPSESFQTAFLSGGFRFADGEVEEGGSSGQQCVGIPHPAVVAELCNHDAADV